MLALEKPVTGEIASAHAAANRRHSGAKVLKNADSYAVTLPEVIETEG